MLAGLQGENPKHMEIAGVTGIRVENLAVQQFRLSQLAALMMTNSELEQIFTAGNDLFAFRDVPAIPRTI